MKRAYGASIIIVTPTAAAEIIPAHCVRAPACWLIAERVSDPEPGMQPNRLPAMLATPSDRHC